MKMTDSTELNFFATTPKGLELLLVDELMALGAHKAAEKLAGVEFTGPIQLAYKACLWSRLANRILLKLACVPAQTPEALYEGVKAINWAEHLDPTATLSVNFVCSQSEITHSLFGAQKVKDAIVDQFREKYQARPSVSREKPAIQVHVYLYRNFATISLDLSGESLHKRGYRLASGMAPLKENLAAAVLLRAKWPEVARNGCMLLDPMCGSGTLLIEAAMMAGDIAPGFSRDYFGFLGWKKYHPSLWEPLIKEAELRREKGLLSLPNIVGYDGDSSAIKIAFENIERANLRGKIHVEKRDLSLLAAKPNIKPGLVIVNPPYGERLGEEERLQKLYELLGEKLKQTFCNWQAGVLTGNSELAKCMGIRAKKYYALYNGAIPCQLLLFDIIPEKFIDRSPGAQNKHLILSAKRATENCDLQAVQMFVNRLSKNLKHRKRQAKRQGIVCYRVYDADLPEYAYSIDISARGAEIQEYAAPKTASPEKVLRRRQEVLSVLPEVLGLPFEQIFFSRTSLKNNR